VRAIFNLFADNQDDHTKNWSFLMDDKGQWQLAPFYDVTFSPSPHNQHMMSYGGYGQKPSVKTIQKLARQASFPHWKEAQNEMVKVLDTLSKWASITSELGISSDTGKLISKQLDQTYQQNKALLE
jgi:serine/threonine-protein kinase HipA